MSEPISTDELDRLERLANGATPGPWRAVYNPQVPGVGAEVYSRGHGKIADREPAKGKSKRSRTFEEMAALPEGYAGIKVADAYFIAACREAVPLLIAEIRRLRE